MNGSRPVSPSNSMTPSAYRSLAVLAGAAETTATPRESQNPGSGNADDVGNRRRGQAVIDEIDRAGRRRAVRDRIGAQIHKRIKSALGPDADARTVAALEMSYFGALVHAGSGAFTYRQIADRLGYVVGLILTPGADT